MEPENKARCSFLYTLVYIYVHYFNVRHQVNRVSFITWAVTIKDNPQQWQLMHLLLLQHVLHRDTQLDRCSSVHYVNIEVLYSRIVTTNFKFQKFCQLGSISTFVSCRSCRGCRALLMLTVTEAPSLRAPSLYECSRVFFRSGICQNLLPHL